LVGMMVHHYLATNGYEGFAVKLAKKLNLEPKANLPTSGLVDIYQAYLTQNAAELNNNCKDVTSVSEKGDLVGLIVHGYLKDNGHDDLAEGLAQKLSLDLRTDLLGVSLESIYQKYHKAKSEKNTLRLTWNKLSDTAKKRLMTSPNPELSISETIRGKVILLYKDYEHIFDQQTVNNGNVYWVCRYHGNPKIGKCGGRVNVHWPSGKIVRFVEHTHAPDAVRSSMKESSMGTADTTLRYSLSKRKTPVLHYRGYAYLKSGRQFKYKTDVRWGCRVYQKINGKEMKCPGYLFTQQGQVVGKVREHNHLPPDVKPQVTEDGNRMLTPLLIPLILVPVLPDSILLPSDPL